MTSFTSHSIGVFLWLKYWLNNWMRHDTFQYIVTITCSKLEDVIGSCAIHHSDLLYHVRKWQNSIYCSNFVIKLNAETLVLNKSNKAQRLLRLLNGKHNIIFSKVLFSVQYKTEKTKDQSWDSRFNTSSSKWRLRNWQIDIVNPIVSAQLTCLLLVTYVMHIK